MQPAGPAGNGGGGREAAGDVDAEGRDVLNLYANNYLGLADDPRVVAAAEQAVREWGYGMASVRFICGTQTIHRDLELRIASFLGTAASFSVVLLLFSRCPHLAGWSFPEIVFLYGFSLLPYGLFSVLSLNLYEFADRYLVEGRFDRILLRPVSPLFQIFFERFRLESLQEVVTGTAAIVRGPRADDCRGGRVIADTIRFPRFIGRP